MALFVGLKQKAGPYELRDDKTGEVTKKGDFHNFYLHYIDEAETSGETLIDNSKYETFIAKIKADDVNSVFGCTVNDSSQFDDMFLKPIELFFNRKGNITLLRFIDEKSSNNKTASK